LSKSLRSKNEENAAEWFARQRRGVMTLEECEELQTWRREPANAAAMAELERLWGLLQIAQDRFGPESLAPPPVLAAKFARSALLALLCVLSLGLGVISYTGNNDFWTKLDWVER
jgi:ferric-dicitrate binding protein FerR (iron transport regulator)